MTVKALAFGFGVLSSKVRRTDIFKLGVWGFLDSRSLVVSDSHLSMIARNIPSLWVHGQSWEALNP